MSTRSPILVPIRDSIATQLLKTVFALYLVLVVTVTLLQLMAQYVQTKTEVLQELRMLEATLKPGLAQALWEMNEPQIHSIMAGVIRLSAVVGIRIQDYDGNIIDQIGQVTDQQGKSVMVDQRGMALPESRASRLFWHEFPLGYVRGDQEFPLAELTHAAGQLDLDNLENITIQVHTSGRNELKMLEETFNAMVQKLLDARTTLYEYANELHQSRQQLQDILDNATAVIFIKDIEGRYVLINRQYEALFHISKAEITGKTDYDVFPEEMADIFRSNDQRVISANKPLEVEEHAPHDDGMHTYLSVKFPLRAPDGRMYAVCGIATDISERKHAEEQIKKLNQELEQRVQERTGRLSETNALLKESEQRLKEAQRIAKLGNWDWNIRTNELFWSDEIYRIFGLHPKEFGATYEAFVQTVHPDDREAVQHAVNNAVYHGESYSIDHRIVLPDDTVRVVHEQGEVTFDEQHEPVRMLGTVQDITERKRMEDDLRRAKEVAETANLAKSTFLANMSHELRTPLHGILGFAQRLEEDTSLTESQQQSIGIIHRNGEHLLTLLNDILDYTKIEADTFELYPAQFALPSLIRQLADMVRLNAERKGVTFICDIPETLPHIVYGDQKRLRQVLLHLLGNAVKFTKEGNVIFRVETGHRPVSTMIRFEIEDTGVGIDPEQIEHIFQPFWQAVPYQLHSEGAGLGLTISQQILRTMGAELHCSSTIGKGSVFWFDIELSVIDATVTDVAEPLPERFSEYPSQETLTTALAALPSDWLVMLRQGAEDVYPEALADSIALIRQRDPILADALTRLAEDFEYDEILKLVKGSL